MLSAVCVYGIVYEVTDFEGKKDVIIVTEPGKVEKFYKAKKITDEATVKLTVTAKEVEAIGTEATFKLKLNTYVYLPTTVKGYTFAPRELKGFDSRFFTEAVQTYENAYISAVQSTYVGTYETKLVLPKEYTMA